MTTKKCEECDSTFSTYPGVFEVEFKNGERHAFCNVCLSEGPLAEVPDEIIIIKKI